MLNDNVFVYYRGIVKKLNPEFDVEQATDEEIIERGQALARGESVRAFEARLRAKAESLRRIQEERERKHAEEKARKAAEVYRLQQAEIEEEKRQEERRKAKLLWEQRVEAEATRRKQEELERQLKAERERVAQEKRHMALIERWRNNPAGIRNEQSLKYTCLNCGSRNAEGRATVQCKDCGRKWYHNHCWNCEGEYVDGRDPETARCTVCGWLESLGYIPRGLPRL